MPGSLFLTLFQDRIVVVQYERGLIGWIVIGLIAGWLAGKIARGAGYGCITDIILGLVGSVLGGWLFMKLGNRGHNISRTKHKHVGAQHAAPHVRKIQTASGSSSSSSCLYNGRLTTSS